jgi:uncharacterized OB-fold protein/acyl dehydratase
MSIDTQLQGYLNKTVGPFIGWDTVQPGIIRHWCDAMGDANPVYQSQEAAKAAGYDDVVAPPTMLQAWGMKGFNDEFPEGSDTANPFEVLVFLESQGYPAVVAVNCEQEYGEPLQVGDSVHFFSRIEHISELKTTALGQGYFVTEVSTYKNQRDEVVGVMTFRVFKFKAHESPQAHVSESPQKPKAIKRMRPVRNYDTAFFWEGVDQSELRIQRCASCQTLRHPPAPMCPSCQSLGWDYVVSAGEGYIYSYVVNHYPEIPPFDYPNPVVLVELDEGTRLVSNLVGSKAQDIEIGARVKVEFVEVEPGFVLHQFRVMEQE